MPTPALNISVDTSGNLMATDTMDWSQVRETVTSYELVWRDAITGTIRQVFNISRPYGKGKVIPMGRVQDGLHSFTASILGITVRSYPLFTLSFPLPERIAGGSLVLTRESYRQDITAQVAQSGVFLLEDSLYGDWQVVLTDEYGAALEYISGLVVSQRQVSVSETGVLGQRHWSELILWQAKNQLVGAGASLTFGERSPRTPYERHQQMARWSWAWTQYQGIREDATSLSPLAIKLVLSDLSLTLSLLCH